MTKRLILFSLLFLSSASWASIAYVGGGTQDTNCMGGSLGSQTCTITISPPNGDYLLLFLKEANPPQTAWCTDNNYRTMIPGNYVIYLNGDSIQSFGIVVSGSPTSFVCNAMGSGVNSMLVAWYSGPLGMNLLMTGGSGLSASCSGNGCASLTPTLDDANDYAVCAFGDTSTNFVAPYTGTQRQPTSGNLNPTLTLVDNTASSAGAITVAASMASSAAWKGVCAELRTVAVPTSYTLLQNNPTIPPTFSDGPSACANTTTSCTWPIATTTAGTLGVLQFVNHADSVSGGEPQRTIVSVADCASLTGGVCAASIDTFILGSSLCPGTHCPQAYVLDSASGSESVDAAYFLSGVGGANWITAVRSGATNPGPPTEPGRYAFSEVQAASGSWVLDNVGTATVFTENTTFTMTPVTISGTNDVIFQGLAGGQQPMLITAPYYYGASVMGHMGFWAAVGVATSTTPTVTAVGLEYGAAGNALAFNTAASGLSVSGITPGTKLTPGATGTP